MDFGELCCVEAKSDLRESKTEVVIDKLVMGVNIDILETLDERTL